MKVVGAWSLVAALGWGLVVGLGACADEEQPAAFGGASGAGGAGQGGAGPAGPAHCTFETPPARAARPEAPVGPVRAGFGEAFLDMPIGAPLGGYGARVRALGGKDHDARKDRINVGMVPSLGQHDRPVIKAVALEVGGERLVLVRIDSIYVLDNAVFALENALAPDGSLRGKVLVASSHSHGAYAAWQASYILMPGGNDRPREDMFQRVLASMKSAAEQALSTLAPARIGVGVTQDFDPQDTVTVDRRKENDELPGPDGNLAGQRKDGQAWALRVDRADGSPLVALVDFPIHGTVTGSGNLLATTDAPGAVERATSALLGYPVIHLQGAGGDVAPVSQDGRRRCPDSFRCLDMPSLELIGARAAQLLKPLVEGVTTGDTAGLEVVTRSGPTGRDVEITRADGRKLSYAPILPEGQEPDYRLFDDDGRVSVPVDEFNTEHGAGLCGDPSGATLAKLPGTLNKLGPYRSCTEVGNGKKIIFSLFDLKAEDYTTPGCDTVRVTTTALRLRGTPSGDYLIATVPGEPTAPLAAYIRNRSPAGPDRTLIVGYAQDHIGYVLTAEDWLSGGYEPSINLWGPLEGEQVAERVIEAARLAWTPEVEDPEAGSSRFLGFQYPPSRRELKVTVTSDHGTAMTETPEKLLWPDIQEAAPTQAGALVPRGVGAARFVFKGGDPLVDTPEVQVEVESSPGVFVPFLDARGQAASSRRAEVILSYVPIPLKADEPTSHAYGATWQPVPPGPLTLGAAARPFSTPVGKYRLRARGKAQAASGLVDYDVASPVFEVTAAPLANGSFLTLESGGVKVRALLGDAPGLRALVEQGASDQGVPLPGPWTVVVTTSEGPKGAKQVEAEKGEATIEVGAGETVVRVEVRDSEGNGGELEP